MVKTTVIEGGNAKRSRKSSSQKRRRLQERGRPKRDRKPFPFLSLPGEIRNNIYWEVLGWYVDRRGPLLGRQPAITRVNRQVRAEALRIYYNTSAFEVRTRTSKEWVPFVQRVLDAFNGGPRGLPSGTESNLQSLGGLSVGFLAKNPWSTGSLVCIEVELSVSPEHAMEPVPEEDCKVVVLGGPDLDWTDAEAVRPAYWEAARQLGDDVRRRLASREYEGVAVELHSASTTADHEAALDAACLLATACPYLSASVCICDASEIEVYNLEDGVSMDEWTSDDDFTDEDFTDEDEY